MTLWLALGAMTVIAAAMIGLPLLRRPTRAAERRRFDIAVYRAQLEELAREEERGLLVPQEAAAARLEVERRMLAADAEPETLSGAALRRRPATACTLMIALLAVSAALYWHTGRPDLPGQPFALRAQRAPQPGADQAASIESLIARLEERLVADPDDLDAWLRLARAYEMTGAFEPAAATYRRAIAVQGEVAALHSGLGEALVMANGGTVGQAAHDAFADALRLEPGDLRARFYDGLWRVQRGELEPALEVWTALAADAPAGAPWLADLRQRVAGLARELGKDPATVLLPLAAASREDLEAQAAELGARLEADPKDFAGWIELARTWNALGDSSRAGEALQQGADAYEGAPFVQQQLRAAAAELGLTLNGAAAANAPRGPTAEQMRAASEMTPEDQTEMIRGMVGGLAARLEDEPDDLEGWRMLARSYQVLQQPQQSADAYAHVALALPDDLEAQLDYADALLAAASPDQPLPEALTRQMSRVLALDPENPGALFYLGQAAVEAGDPAAARTHWQRLLAQIPADAPQRAQIQQLIDQLPAP